MFPFRSPFLLFLSLFLLLFCFSYATTPHFHHLSYLQIHEHVVGEVEFGGLVPWESRRFLAQESEGNSSMILAAKRTYRRDPINDFKRYTGGWNISNSHYWASVGFTAAPFFVIAGVWFLVFGLSLSFICLCYCCCRREPYGYSRFAYALSLILLILFTLAAVVGCIVLYTGQGKLHSSTTNTLNYVVSQADTTAQGLKNVSDYLAAAKSTGIDSMFLSKSVQKNIDSIESKINSSSATLSNKTEDNAKDIKHGLNSMRLSLIILAAVMLILASLGFLFSIFGMQFLVYFLVIVGWILVTGTFILCGVFLLLHNVVGDTCVAMDQWVQHPTAHTALDDILPCMDNATAQETLLQSKDVTNELVGVINSVVNITNGNYQPKSGMYYFNQSGPLLPALCNPFNPDLSNRQCAAGEVDFNNASAVWKTYICELSASGICATTGRLTPMIYSQMLSGVNVTYGLYRYGPFLVDLVDCTFVRKTFTDIRKDQCPGLLRDSQWIYIGLVMVSVAVMLSLIFWVIYARERRHRVYTKRFITRPAEDQYKGT